MDLKLSMIKAIEEETRSVEEFFIQDTSDPLDEVFLDVNRKKGRPSGSVDAPKIRAERLLRKAVKFLKEAQKHLESFRGKQCL